MELGYCIFNYLICFINYIYCFAANLIHFFLDLNYAVNKNLPHSRFIIYFLPLLKLEDLSPLVCISQFYHSDCFVDVPTNIGYMRG